MIPFAEWLPDQPDYLSQGTKTALNVVPTRTGYGPLQSLAEWTGALTTTCRGAISARGDSGAIETFAGDDTKLYSLNVNVWQDESKVGGYNCGDSDMWRFAQFGNTVLATNYADAIQAWTLGSSTVFADLSASAPKAKVMGVIGDFLVVGNTYDSGDGARGNRIWWPAINNPASWPTIGSDAAVQVQSDLQDLPTGGEVRAIVPAGSGGTTGLVFCQSAIHMLTYVGSPAVFRRDEIDASRGALGAGAVVPIGGGRLAFWAEDGFHAWTGAGIEPIGAERVDSYFDAKLDLVNLHRITSAADPVRKLAFWSFPSVDSNGEPDRLAILNWQTMKWSEGEVNCEILFRGLSEAISLDDLDNIVSSIDALDISLDDRLWVGGQLLMGGFTSAHKLGKFGTTTLAATLGTGEFGESRRVFVSGARPLVDGGVTDGAVTVSIGYRELPDASVSYTTATRAGADGICPQRISTRYARARVQIAAGTSWQNAQGIEPVTYPDGER